MDLVDLVKQIYDIRDAVQKIYSDFGEDFLEVKKMLEIEVGLPVIDVDLVGELMIEKNIREERYIPFWLKLALHQLRNIGGDKVIVDSLALRIYEDKGVYFDLKLCYSVPSTTVYSYETDKMRECNVFSFRLLKNRRNTTKLWTLIIFAYLTTDDDWRYIMDELGKFASKKSELEKAVSQLKAAIATLKLVS
jgi:hypothetical protein